MDDVPLMDTDVGVRLHVAELVALVGPLTEHVRPTVPANELDGVTVMVDVLPDAAAGLTEMLPLLLRAKSVEEVDEDASQKPLHPDISVRAAINGPAHFERLIPAPGGWFAAPISSCRLALPIQFVDFLPDALLTSKLCAKRCRATHTIRVSLGGCLCR
jgi:hypothetical protein